MRAVRFLRSAERDIEEIAAFLGHETPGRADRALRMLMNRTGILADFPHLGVAVGAGVRQMVFKDRWNSFTVRYRATDRAILISRIWHGKQDRPSS